MLDGAFGTAVWPTLFGLLTHTSFLCHTLHLLLRLPQDQKHYLTSLCVYKVKTPWWWSC